MYRLQNVKNYGIINTYKVLIAGDQIRMDNLNKFWQKFEKQNGHQITKLSITHSFLGKILKNKMAAKSQNWA